MLGEILGTSSQILDISVLMIFSQVNKSTQSLVTSNSKIFQTIAKMPSQEPLLKNQYLTKLQRILPSYLEGLGDEEMARALDEVSTQIKV